MIDRLRDAWNDATSPRPDTRAERIVAAICIAVMISAAIAWRAYT